MTTPPRNPYLAGNWLVARHPWLKDLAERVVGSTSDNELWLDDLAAAIRGLDEHDEAMSAYAKRHPMPEDDDAHARWLAAGPQLDPASAAYEQTSIGDGAALQLLATLADPESPWSVHDLIALDPRGERVAVDWLRIVQDQLDWLHEINQYQHDDGGDPE